MVRGKVVRRAAKATRRTKCRKTGILTQIASILVLVAALMAALPSEAQTNTGLRSPILVVDLEKLFNNSDFGRKVASDYAAVGNEIAAENRRIEAELIAEEKALADQRPTMEQSEFRALADAFDIKVQKMRETQRTKLRDLSQSSEAAKSRFFEFAQPVLEGIMVESNAVVIMELNSVVLNMSAIDITQEAIKQINQNTQSVEPTTAEE